MIFFYPGDTLRWLPRSMRRCRILRRLGRRQTQGWTPDGRTSTAGSSSTSLSTTARSSRPGCSTSTRGSSPLQRQTPLLKPLPSCRCIKKEKLSSMEESKTSRHKIFQLIQIIYFLFSETFEGLKSLGSSLVAEGHGEAATIGEQVDKTVEIRLMQ